MSLRGIDASSWQTNLDLNNIIYDFVTEKATEGTTYVNPDCDSKVQAAIYAGKKFGVYHFAGHTDARAEADFFVDNCVGYLGKGILVLDWEGAFVDDVAWAKRWLDRVYERTGVKPLIYMSEWVVNNYDWSSVIDGDYGLWVAKYSDYEIDHNYDMSNAGDEPNVSWGSVGYIMWQWTSVGRLDGYGGNLDVDVFYGDQSTWDAYARPNTPNPAPQPDPTPSSEPTPDPEPTPEPPVEDEEPVPVPDPGTVVTPDPGEEDGPVDPEPSKPVNTGNFLTQLAPYAKAVAAFLALLIPFLASLGVLLADMLGGRLDSLGQDLTLVGASGTALVAGTRAVYQVRNKPLPKS